MGGYWLCSSRWLQSRVCLCPLIFLTWFIFHVPHLELNSFVAISVLAPISTIKGSDCFILKSSSIFSFMSSWIIFIYNVAIAFIVSLYLNKWIKLNILYLAILNYWNFSQWKYSFEWLSELCHLDWFLTVVLIKLCGYLMTLGRVILHAALWEPTQLYQGLILCVWFWC